LKLILLWGYAQGLGSWAYREASNVPPSTIVDLVRDFGARVERRQ